MTTSEVVEYVERNAGHSGLRLYESGEKKLFFADEEANAIQIAIPATPGRLAYLARVLSLLGAEDESMFYGAVLWVTLYGIGCDHIERTGFTMLDLLRRSSGENRPFEAAPGHAFRSGAHVELAAFLVPCLVFWWDTWLKPSRGDLFVYISHDEEIIIATRNQESYDSCWAALETFAPRAASTQNLTLVCPNSRARREPF